MASKNYLPYLQKISYYELLQLSQDIIAEYNIYIILSGLLLNRIKFYSKNIISDYQCGLMCDKLTKHHVFSVKWSVKKHYKFNITQFVNNKPVYNTRYNTLYSRITFEIPATTVRIIKTCMRKMRYQVRFNKHASNEFKVETKLRQGEVLSFEDEDKIAAL